MYYIKNYQAKRIDLFFDKKPDEAILTFLVNDNWHWNRSMGCWQTFLSQDHINVAESLGAVDRQMPLAHQKATNISKPITLLNGPLFSTLYCHPSTVQEIRTTPIGIEDLAPFHISADLFFQYLQSLYKLYVSCKDPSSHSFKSLVLFDFSILEDFCKEHKFIPKTFSAKISADFLFECAEDSFTEFRLWIERFFAGVFPLSQFVKCAYGVDLVVFEWWKYDTTPDMYILGHCTSPKKPPTALSPNELIALQRQLFVDMVSKKYSNLPVDVADTTQLAQIIFWHLETIPTAVCHEDNTIYIHKGRIICQMQQHPIIQATAILANPTGADIRLNVNYCPQCKKFFMHYDIFQHYRKQYGILLGDLKFLSGSTFDRYAADLAAESPLHLCGYTVAEKEGLSPDTRQQILAFVIDRGILSKENVIEHLRWLIDMNHTSMHLQTAIQKWQQDLSFVLNYHAELQPHFIAEKLKAYPPNRFEF